MVGEGKDNVKDEGGNNHYRRNHKGKRGDERKTELKAVSKSRLNE